MTNKEIMNYLNWMLSNGIITTSEYNKLLLKALPYVKG